MLCGFDNWAQVVILSFAAVGIASAVLMILALRDSANDMEGY